ncbi:MAG TPA: hypothetical protein VMK12_27865 [Anaeromyxobacteraceae bacterium]|nr:hypothetical protein [Anaeromyxobacteraceae bacterium]
MSESKGTDSPVRVRVRLFGALRKYSSEPEIAFDVPRNTRVAALREHLTEILKRTHPAFDGALITASVLADESRILREDEEVGTSADEASLALLPPVCGGSQ